MIWQVNQKALLGLILFTTSALAVNCTAVSVKSESDAETLRQNCPIITGNLTIGPFPQNVSSVHIKLDGIEFINGSINHEAGDGGNTFTVSSSTLLKVGGSVIFGGDDDKACNVNNFTAPNLSIVSGSFWIGTRCSDLTYLDITSLEYVDYIHLEGRSLTTLRHTKLSNTTGLWIGDTLIDSVDSLFNNPLNITGEAILGTLPNVRYVTVGFQSAYSLEVFSNTTVILGGSSTTEMSLESLRLSGLTGLERSPKLESLTAEVVTIMPTGNISQIYLPFDDLRMLSVSEAAYSNVVTLRLPAKAVNWTGGFMLDVVLSPGLNLSSMYGVDEQGNNIQTWYWPTNVSYIRISETIVANPFFDTFVAQQNGLTNGTTTPSVLGGFSITPSNRSHFNSRVLAIIIKYQV
ncbi:uncharacterized protein N7473_009250 [Penicillium subrubescens]|uniref:uncharacterized protein n=1 Tax=Penicillium subrubescens TaxID=1316194 RepID=UPI002544DEE8|nr:uncharacterized protein N7473_009250 [Penicillium subrubescens]KAJ5886576.1 hypothetical protein N7473_009250 [Penicillium subrubescens]